MQQSPFTFAKFGLALLFLFGLMVSNTQAQPLSLKRDTTLLSHPPANYRFITKDMSSADEQHHYQLFIGIPTTPAPESGYSVIYALDGNAVISRLTSAQLQQLTHPPVIVAIGYPTDAMFDGNARTLDYTPAKPTGETLDPVHGRPAGGSEQFTATIATQIKPYVESQVKINHQQQYLWGHSYGGLFVLNTYFKHQSLFNYYLAASPSLWWQEGLILNEQKSYLSNHPEVPADLWIFSGSDESKENKVDPAKLNPAYEKMLAARTALPDDAGDMFIAHFKQGQIPVEKEVFEGLNHGRMFPAALNRALQIIQQNTH